MTITYHKASRGYLGFIESQSFYGNTRMEVILLALLTISES
jgi:hypothetical protein